MSSYLQAWLGNRKNKYYFIRQQMNSGKLENIAIKDLIPHRGRMLLIEEILEIDHSHAVTVAVADKSWPLAGNNGIQPLILVELAAQTAGVCNGWDRIINQGVDSEKKGWLVGVKQADFHVTTIPFNSRIIIRSENSHKYDLLREISSTMQINNTIIGNVILQLIQA